MYILYIYIYIYTKHIYNTLLSICMLKGFIFFTFGAGRSFFFSNFGQDVFAFLDQKELEMNLVFAKMRAQHGPYICKKSSF